MLLKGLNLILMLGSVLFVMFAYIAISYLLSRVKRARHNTSEVSKKGKNLTPVIF